ANPTLAEQMIWIMALSGLIGTLMGVAIGPRIALATRIPGPLVTPFVFVISVVGVYITDQLHFSVGLLVIFMLFGLALRRLRYPIAGMVMAFVLGQTLETNLYLTGQINDYYGFGFVTHRPIADGLLILAIVIVIAKWRDLRQEMQQQK